MQTEISEDLIENINSNVESVEDTIVQASSGKAKALIKLRPGASWSYANGVLDWQDTEQTEPTQAEIDAEVIRLQAEYDNQQYQRDRQYPSLKEQADMAYWDRKNGTTTLDDALDAVKAEYPKPTE
jgi:hypothetical protein